MYCWHFSFFDFVTTCRCLYIAKTIILFTCKCICVQENFIVFTVSVNICDQTYLLILNSSKNNRVHPKQTLTNPTPACEGHNSYKFKFFELKTFYWLTFQTVNPWYSATTTSLEKIFLVQKENPRKRNVVCKIILLGQITYSAVQKCFKNSML